MGNASNSLYEFFFDVSVCQWIQPYTVVKEIDLHCANLLFKEDGRWIFSVIEYVVSTILFMVAITVFACNFNVSPVLWTQDKYIWNWFIILSDKKVGILK